MPEATALEETAWHALMVRAVIALLCSQVAFGLNTVIFLIAGCKLGGLAADANFYSLYQPGSGSLLMFIFMYPIILFARGVAILIFFPIIRVVGTGATWQPHVIGKQAEARAGTLAY